MCSCGHPATGDACKYGFAQHEPTPRTDYSYDDDTWPVDRCVVCGHTRDCHASRPTPTAGTQRANSNTDSN